MLQRLHANFTATVIQLESVWSLLLFINFLNQPGSSLVVVLKLYHSSPPATARVDINAIAVCSDVTLQLLNHCRVLLTGGLMHLELCSQVFCHCFIQKLLQALILALCRLKHSFFYQDNGGTDSCASFQRAYSDQAAWTKMQGTAQEGELPMSGSRPIRTNSAPIKSSRAGFLGGIQA